MNIYIENHKEILAISEKENAGGIGNALDMYDNRHGLSRDFKARKAYYEHFSYPVPVLLEEAAAGEDAGK